MYCWEFRVLASVWLESDDRSFFVLSKLLNICKYTYIGYWVIVAVSSAVLTDSSWNCYTQDAHNSFHRHTVTLHHPTVLGTSTCHVGHAFDMIQNILLFSCDVHIKQSTVESDQLHVAQWYDSFESKLSA